MTNSLMLSYILRYLFYIHIFIYVCSGTLAYSQKSNIDTNAVMPNKPSIAWVKTWNSTDNKSRKKGVREWFNTILFGIKQQELINPVSIWAKSQEDFWVLDQGGKTLFQIKNGVGDIPHSISNTEFVLSSLVGICSDDESNILFTDSHSNKVYKFSKDKKKLKLLNDTLQLEQPTGIAFFSKRNEFWVVETKQHRISILNNNGEIIKRIGKRGTAPGEFNYPTHIWIDKMGYIYICDAMNFRVQILNSEGNVIKVFGEAGDATGYFARPKGIATDSFGNIYIVDALFHAVQVFNQKGEFLYTFGHQGHENGEFWMPNGIFIDSQNYIYVADFYNSRVQIFQMKEEGLK